MRLEGSGNNRHQELLKAIVNMKRFEVIKYLTKKGYTTAAASRACNQVGFKQGDCKASSNN